MNDDKAWEAIKENAAFLMRGTMEEISKQDMSKFADGKEYIFAILYTEDSK